MAQSKTHIILFQLRLQFPPKVVVVEDVVVEDLLVVVDLLVVKNLQYLVLVVHFQAAEDLLEAAVLLEAVVLHHLVVVVRLVVVIRACLNVLLLLGLLQKSYVLANFHAIVCLRVRSMLCFLILFHLRFLIHNPYSLWLNVTEYGADAASPRDNVAKVRVFNYFASFMF